MVSIPNRFYRGMVYNSPNYKHPNFISIIVDTIAEFKDGDGNMYHDSFASYADFINYDRSVGDIFYGVYGSYWIDIPKSSIIILETDDLNRAIHIAEEIMGNKITEMSI